MSRQRYLLLGDGSSPHLLKWVKELVKYFDVYLISLREIQKEIFGLVDRDHLFYITCGRLHTKGRNLLFFLHLPKIIKIIKKINPTFVNAHYLTSYGLAAALVQHWCSGKFFLVQSTWGTDILVTPLKNWLFSISTRYSLNRARLITSDSEFMSEKIRQYTTTPVLTFTFGLDRLPTLDPKQKQKGLFFSNRILSENYNIDEVLLFFSKIAQREKNAQLIIANDGEQRFELEDLARRLQITDRVRFNGFLSTEKQEEWYRKAEFFISIPTSDSTSVSLLEAMAYGCIPIVSDIPANHEWVTDGSAGIFYSQEMDFETLQKFRTNENITMEKNRKLICEKAIFPESIHKFSQYLMKQIEVIQ
jgi:L-malate glycosyltransferase